MKSSGNLLFPHFSSFLLNLFQYLSRLLQIWEWMLFLLLRTTVYPDPQHYINEELRQAVLYSPFSFGHCCSLLKYLSRLPQFSEWILYFDSGPRSSQDYSTITRKGSGEQLFPYFSRFHFFTLIKWISISFTSILRVNIVSFTQDHSQLNTTAPLQ